MPVIAALAHEREPIAEAAQETGRPRSERHHDAFRVDAPFGRHDRPATLRLGERRRVAARDRTTSALEQPRIGRDQAAGVQARPRLEPVDGTAAYPHGESWLGARELVGRKRAECDAVLFVQFFGLGDGARERPRLAMEMTIAFAPDEVAGTRGG